MFIRRLVEIDERWEKVDGIVYRLHRFVPSKKWIREETPYKEIPVVILEKKAQGGE